MCSTLLAQPGPGSAATAGRLAELMDTNFDLRRSLYGDAALGAVNIAMVECARSCGAAAKFCGSGGCVLVCCPAGPEQVQKVAGASLESVLLWTKVAHRTTSKVWQLVNVGKCPRTPNNQIFSGALRGQHSRYCLGVVYLPNHSGATMATLAGSIAAHPQPACHAPAVKQKRWFADAAQKQGFVLEKLSVEPALFPDPPC